MQMKKMQAWLTLLFLSRLSHLIIRIISFPCTWLPVLFGPFQPIEKGKSLEVIAWPNNSVFVISLPEIISAEHEGWNTRRQ